MFANLIISKVRGAVKAIGIIALMILGVLIVLFERVEARSAANLSRPADVIIVLGSAVYPGERPSPSLAARTRQAIALYQSGYAPHLIFSGGLGFNPPSEAEAMRRIAINAGVPAEAIVLEDRSHSTEANLANSQAIMNVRGWRTALVVSAPYHLLRAELVAQDLGMSVIGAPARDDPTFAAPHLRIWYTLRESLALLWYYATRLTGEPGWLYAWLKGNI
jgi:uncharacterized SAM-binding protein YcdF (DUF218 family)